MIDNSVLKRLAIQQFGTVLVQGKEYFELDEADLQAFAQAVIEDYKAGLVPVAWSSPNDFHISYKATENYYIPLYALPSGETK